MRVQEIADFLSARLIGNPARDITAAASLSAAGPADLSFIEDAKYLDRAAHCRAGAVLAGEFAADGVPGLESTLIIVNAPRLAFAKAVAFMTNSGRKPSGVHSTAVVDPAAQLGAQVSIDAHSVVGKNVRIGARTRIGPGCVLFDDVALGDDCELVARVTIYSKTRLGHRVVVHAGAQAGIAVLVRQGRANRDVPQISADWPARHWGRRGDRSQLHDRTGLRWMRQ
jgi:UDP-3-O-[3-hydroxymyristoyl] glucosamine N-acyltransferase